MNPEFKDRCEFIKFIAGLTESEFISFADNLKALVHYHDTTVGLWATDKPENFNDPEKILFRLKPAI